MPELSIAIINWNTREALRACLASVRDAAAPLDAEIIVVDNASDDGSARMQRREFPDVRGIDAERNLGFAGGVNVALGAATGEFILLLNPDVQIGREPLDMLLGFLRERPRVAAVAPMLIGTDGHAHAHLYRRMPTLKQLLLFWTLLAPITRRFGPLRRRWFEHDLRGREPTTVDQIPGAAMLIRRDAIRRIGPFDSDYFIWFEDVDWCYRARRAGLDLYVLPDARVSHDGGASFRRWVTETRVKQFYRAFIRFVCKHHLDRLRRWGWPVLAMDLALKSAVLRIARTLHLPGAPAVKSLASVRAAVREVLANERGGRLVRFVDADSPGRLPRESSDFRSGRRTTATRSGAVRVDAVIVNWNGRRFLPRCLNTLERAGRGVRVIVVDNASDDGSVEYIRSEHPDVEIVALGSNVGYAAGANVGLHRGTAPYGIVLNPDIALAPGYLDGLVARAEADLSIGAAQGKLYCTSPEDFLAGRLEPGGVVDSAGHVIRRTRMVYDRGQGERDGPAYSYEASTFSACGAALFLRRAMLEDLAADGEYFDSRFFAYKEDIDLCWRARLLGWDIRYIPDAIGWHVRSWAGGRVPKGNRIPAAARRHSWKNHYLLMLKNDRVADMLRSLPAIAAWEAVRHGYALLQNPRMYRAYADLIRQIPGTFRKRRVMLKRRRVPASEIRRWFGSWPTAMKDSNGNPNGSAVATKRPIGD